MPARPQRHRIALPRRTRRYGFSLTPLADAMFQLLVFFMLSSDLSPYSLLTVRSGAVEGGTGGAAPDAAPAGTALRADQTVIWNIGRDSVSSGGQRFGFERLGDLAAGMKASGNAQVLLVTQGGAQVQGLVSVLEALSAQGIAQVQIAAAPGTAPVVPTPAAPAPAAPAPTDPAPEPAGQP